MNTGQVPYNEIDDYIATLTEEEQKEVALAEEALDLAQLLYLAREERGLSQKAAAQQAGIHQQAVSRLEHAVATTQLATLQRYLAALGYSIDVIIKDTQTGDVVGQVTLVAASS